MKTAQGLIKHCKAVYAWKYVYGCKGEILTRAKYNQLKKQYGSAVWESDVHKVGHMCCDCSGLISSYTGILRGSANYKATALEVLSINELTEQNWNRYIGWALWMPGHIGVVSDTKGYYYAMDGSGRNWVHYPLKKQKWTHILKLKDVEYTTNGWTNVDGAWYYYCDRERVENSWIRDKGKWYYLDASGTMATDRWIMSASGNWSYVDSSGAAVTGWKQLDWQGSTNWYFFDDDGTMMRDSWINDYYVSRSGAMLTNVWVPWKGKYYWVGHDGKWLDKSTWISHIKPEDGYPIYNV